MNRTMGLYAASVATSLALEGLCGTGECVDTNKGFKVNNYSTLFVNLRTIIRNAIGSFDYEDQMSLLTRDIVKAVEQDFEVINKEAPEHLHIVPYLCTHKSLNKEFKGKHRQYETPRQKTMFAIEEAAVLKLYESNKEGILEFDIELKGDSRTIILTHHPIDLLSAHKFPELVLLESHEGKLKEQPAWTSKLRTVKNPAVIPFNKVTLQMFADNSMFMPQPKKMRDVLEKIGAKRKWNASTSQSTMLLDVRNSYEPHLYKHLKTLE